MLSIMNNMLVFLYKYEGKGDRGLSPKSNPWEILSNLTDMEAIATM